MQKWILALISSLIALGCGRITHEVSHPNVILVITDDQGYGDLGAHGNPVLQTPHLDRLHERSIRLTNFHVSPTCSPTRAAVMTGRYPNATGVWHTIMGRSLLHREEVTLADLFRDTGYRTGIFGKWHLGDNYPFRPQDRGFDEALVHGGGGIWQTPDYFTNDYFDDTYFRNGEPEKLEGFCTDVWFTEAMRFMADAKSQGRPFFCYLSTNAPHAPMWAPDEYSRMYTGVEGLREPGFYGMITNIDDNVGRLIRFLREEGLEEDTIFIFMTDNGTAAGEEVFNAGMRGKKGSPYDGGHRVPFFLSWPGGGLTGPADIDVLTAHVDILPTLVDLCGLRVPESPTHGLSLRDLLYGRPTTWPRRVIVTDSQRLDDLVKWRQTAVLMENWRLVNPTPDGDPARLELYDIQKDPGQEHDLAAHNRQLVEELVSAYEEWWRLASERADEYSRIVLGDPAENPARLTSHDWHGEGALRSWNQRAIRQAPAVNGWWAVEISRSGRYRFELRRWPRELDLPLDSSYRDADFNRETTHGKAIQPVKARLRIGAVDETKAIVPADRAAVFEVELERGPAQLQTWLYEEDGTERGAYFVYVRRLN